MSIASSLSEEFQLLQKTWGLMLVMGIALILVGAAAIGAQVFATLATILVLGILLIAGGVVELISAFGTTCWKGCGTHLLSGALYLVLGFLMINNPLNAAAVLTLVLGVMLMAGGLVRILAAVSQRFHGWAWALLNGVISLFLGIVIWRGWLEQSLFIIGLFVGIDMVFSGWSWVLTALAIRNLRARPV
jgi:uncharacterized membrane protein HdeD (DUF308 family)